MIWKRGLPKNFGKSIDFCNVSKNRLFTAMELTHASLLCDEDMKIFVYHFWGWLGAMLKNLHGEKHHYLLNQWTTQRVIGHWYPCLIQLSGRFDPNCPCAGSCCSISNWSASSDTINCNGRLINVVSFVFWFRTNNRSSDSTIMSSEKLVDYNPFPWQVWYNIFFNKYEVADL